MQGVCGNILRIILVNCYFFVCLFLGLCAYATPDNGSYLYDLPQADMHVGDVEINILRNERSTENYIEIAQDLIQIKKDRPFDKKTFLESVDALKLCEKFSKIHVDSEEKNGKLILKFYLTPFRYIRDIRIEGGAPLFEKEILNVMSIYVGDVFDEKKALHQIGLIKDLFKKEGFYMPHVDVRWQQDRKDESYILFINIHKGPHYQIGGIHIHGNRYFGDFRLKMKTRSYKFQPFIGVAGRFTQKDLKSDIKKLKAFYLEKNFPEAVIEYKTDRIPEKGSVVVNVYIQEGPKYKIKFEGNDQFSNWTLKKDLTYKTIGNKNNAGTRKSITNLKARYRKAGYPSVKIKADTSIEDVDDYQINHITFNIKEGPRLKIEGVQINGNEIISKKTIEKQMLSAKKPLIREWVYNPDMIDEDLYAIKSLYLKNGFPDAKIELAEEWDASKEQATLLISISEGPQAIVKDIDINTNISLETKKVYKALHHHMDKPLQKYMIKNDENVISAIVSEKGYPHVSVASETTIKNEGKDAYLRFNVDEGPLVKMGKAYYSGNFRTKEKVLSDAIEIKENEPFSLMKILEGQRNIRNLGIFNSVKYKTIGLKEKNDTITLFAQLEEKKPYFISLGSGYESDRGFFLEGSTGDYNFFGTGRHISIGGEISQTGYKEEITLTDPRFFGTNISSEFNLFAEKVEEFHQTFGTRERGASIGFRSGFLKHYTVGLDYGFSHINTYERFGEDIPDPSEEENKDITYGKRTSFTVTPSISYDTRDSFIRPQKGKYIFVSTEISKGIEDSRDDYIKYRTDTRYFRKLTRHLTLAGLLRLGYIDPYGAAGQVTRDVRFYLGGIGSIRGYKENTFEYDEDGDTIGGRFSGQASIELRLLLKYNLELTLFYDAGKLSNLGNENVEGDIKTTTGAGLRYITPIGPIGIMYGVKLDKKPEEAPDRWHFSMGYSF